jgi:hypothetical protein
MSKYEFLITYAPPHALQSRIDEYLAKAKSAGRPDEVTETRLARWRETLGHAESQLIEDLKQVGELSI